jgi:hypothetical protein
VLHEVALDVGEMFGEFGTFLGVGAAGAAEFIYACEKPFFVLCAVDGEEVDAEDVEFLCEVVVDKEIVESGDEFTPGQIAFGPEDGDRCGEYFLLFHLIELECLQI